MVRPLKAVSSNLKTRNNRIDPQTAQHILNVAIESSLIQVKKLPAADQRYVAHEIASDTMTSLLTSESFDPNRSLDDLTRYIRHSAKMKANTHIRSYINSLARKIEYSNFIKIRCRY